MTKLPTGRHTQTIKSAKQDKKRFYRNKSRKSEAKTALKKAREAASAGSKEAEELYDIASKKLDSAAVAGAFHKNKAARLKSRLRKLINKSKG